MKTLFLSILLSVLFAAGSEARQIADMLGRQVEVPEHIERVLGSVAPATWMLYAVAPELLVGLNSAPVAADWEYLRPELKSLPVIGSCGGVNAINREMLLALRPDVMVFWSWGQQAATRQWTEQLAAWGIPVVFVTLERVEQYPAVLRFLGEMLGRTARAELLAGYGEQVLDRVREATRAIPPERRLRVYYAEGPDGLATEPAGSFHAELIPLAGGDNVHRGRLQQHAGREKLGLEQVLLYDPQVILAQESSFWESVGRDSRWRNVAAVREGKVWSIPDRPLNWFDRPPSFMRFLGLSWLTHRLYPQRFPFDEASETREFYRLFLGVALSDTQLSRIMPPSPSS